MLPFLLFQHYFGTSGNNLVRSYDSLTTRTTHLKDNNQAKRERVQARMAPREELLLILDLTSTVLRAGVGVADLIRGPLLVRSTPLTSPLSLLRADLGILQLQELPTRLGRKFNTKGTQVEDYLVGHYLSEAERTGTNEHEVVYPLQVDPKVGFIVTDWVGLEAIL